MKRIYIDFLKHMPLFFVQTARMYQSINIGTFIQLITHNFRSGIKIVRKHLSYSHFNQYQLPQALCLSLAPSLSLSLSHTLLTTLTQMQYVFAQLVEHTFNTNQKCRVVFMNSHKLSFSLPISCYLFYFLTVYFSTDGLCRCAAPSAAIHLSFFRIKTKTNSNSCLLVFGKIYAQ